MDGCARRGTEVSRLRLRASCVSAGTLAGEITRKGLETVYFDIAQQDEWGKRFPLYNLIPYNTDGRRIFGYLRALEEDCEILIAMDDDNFPSADDFIGCHQQTGKKWNQPVLAEPARASPLSFTTTLR